MVRLTLIEDEDICKLEHCRSEEDEQKHSSEAMDHTTIPRFGANYFQLHPPKQGQLIVFVGANGMWKSIVLDATIKPHFVDHLRKAHSSMDVGLLLEKYKNSVKDSELCASLELNQLIDHNVGDLSGGEIQRLAIGLAAMGKTEMHKFIEPSCFLDVKQRAKAGQIIEALLGTNSDVIVVAKDHSISEFSSDFCLSYGIPGAHEGVVLPFSIRERINIFLDPTENPRLGYDFLTLKKSSEESQASAGYKYPTMTIKLGNFKLCAVEGHFTNSEIIVMLGENGTGKTTLIRMLAGLLTADTVDGRYNVKMPDFKVSYKPQNFPLSPNQTTVRCLLNSKIGDACSDPQFVLDVMKPLLIEQLMDQDIMNLTHAELQRVALCLCLGEPADIYLIDEPSAYLDSEQRATASKVIKDFIHGAKKLAFVSEHDFTNALYLATRIIVFEGEPSINCVANSPVSLLSGVNRFLSNLQAPKTNRIGPAKDQSAPFPYYLDD